MHIWPSVEASGLLPLGAILFTNIILSTSRPGPVCGRIDGKVKWASVRWEQGYHVYAPSSALLPTCLALCKLALLSADWIYTLYSTIWSSPKLNLIASANRTFLGWNFRAIFTAHQKKFRLGSPRAFREFVPIQYLFGAGHNHHIFSVH